MEEIVKNLCGYISYDEDINDETKIFRFEQMKKNLCCEDEKYKIYKEIISSYENDLIKDRCPLCHSDLSVIGGSDNCYYYYCNICGYIGEKKETE